MILPPLHEALAAVIDPYKHVFVRARIPDLLDLHYPGRIEIISDQSSPDPDAIGLALTGRDSLVVTAKYLFELAPVAVLAFQAPEADGPFWKALGPVESDALANDFEILELRGFQSEPGTVGVLVTLAW